jgi:kynurenine formamidase
MAIYPAIRVAKPDGWPMPCNRHPGKTGLLASEILIVGHPCNLINFPDKGYIFSAVPPKVRSMAYSR